MQIVIAHSDLDYIEKVKDFFVTLDIESIEVFLNGFEALTFILEQRPKIAFIEENLPGLNANDIRNVLISKRVDTDLKILQLDSYLDSLTNLE